MLKLYRPHSSGYTGQDVQSWDHVWEGTSIRDAVQWAAICHLRPIFDRYFPRSAKILEGGCGLGQFVIYYRSRGYDIEGIDFSPVVISRLKTFDLTLPVQLGDVTSLPYPDGSVQCYYSGGVVEHFEEGPFVALAEARRVLGHDGRLLITVPYVNWIRQAQSRLGVRRRRWDTDRVILLPRRHFAREAPPVPGYRFAEYVFSRGEFARILEGCGFKVEASHPCDLEWGEVCQFLYRRFRRADHPVAATVEPTGVESDRSDDGAERIGRLRKFCKEFFVTERSPQAWLSPLLRMLTEVSGHMALFVCRPVKS